MAIQNRRGTESGFDANKLLPGEFAVSLDGKFVYICFSPGVVKKMATNEDFQSMLDNITDITDRAEAAVTSAEGLLINHAGINDTTPTITEAYSGVKTESLVAGARTYADTKISSLVNSSPATLDTLKELADALGDDPNFATTVMTAIGNKLDKTGDSKDNVITFTDAASDTDSVSGEKHSVILGKISKSIKTFRTAISSYAARITAVEKLSVMTTQGDIIAQGASVPVRIPKGAAGQVLTMNSGATAPEWQTVSASGGSSTSLVKDILLMKMRQPGLFTDPDAMSDTLEDTTGLNTTLCTNLYFDSANKSLKVLDHAGIDSYTKLMLHGNGTSGSTVITDSSLTPKTVTANGNAQISTSTKVFGTGSLYFDGVGDYLSVPDSDDFYLSTTPFTFDFRMNTNTIATGTYPIFSQYVDANNNFMLLMYNGGSSLTIGLDCRIGGTAYNHNITLSISAGAWYHIECVYDGSSVKWRLNGVQIGNPSWSCPIPNFAVPVQIGGCSGSGKYFAGYIDEFRFSKGIARHSADFTPLTGEYGIVDSATAVWNAFTASMIPTKAIIEALLVIGTGAITYYISRDGGTTYTACTLNTVMDISAQPSGSSIVLKAVITGNSELQAIAEGVL